MDRRDSLHSKFPSYLLVLLTVLGYIAVFSHYYRQTGIGVASLAIIPVMVASWYLGSMGGMIIAVVMILSNTFILLLGNYSFNGLYLMPGNIIGTFSLFVVAFVFGKLTKVIDERKDALLKLEQYERERESHTKFLELLNQITAKALEANSLQATLEILTEKLAHLFSADDAFFAMWDATREVTIPTLAFGSLHDVYPYTQFAPGEVTLTASVMKAEHPIPVPDIENSEYMSRKVASMFPSRSMLGIPLITQQRKLGSILLGYDQKRDFDREVILHAEITAEQLALVLSKSQLLEEERKQVRQLTALHDVALVSVEADDQDHLIEQVTSIIGQNLFPDNFGILLLDEQQQVLRAHPSYRFHSTEKKEILDVQLGSGVSGEVARTGQSQRIGNVRRVQNYLDMDDRTISELCVPIKFKEHILGVINAESTKRDAFTEDDERLLVTLAGQLATALKQLHKAQDERKWLDQLAHSNDLIYSVAQITAQIESSLTADAIVQRLGKELESLQLTCIMAIYDKRRKRFTINYTSLSPQFLEIVENGLGYPLVNYTFPHHKLKAVLNAEEMLRPAVISNPNEEIEAIFTHINKEGVVAILEKIGVVRGVEPLRLPLVFEKNLLGLLWVWGQNVARSDLPIMSIFAKQVGISLERARLFHEVQSLALTDPLTGLQNRRSIFELGRIEFSRADRMNRPFCCMMLDVDFFKQVNDNHGHVVGDHVLREFAQRCKNSVREVDLVGRYGGEELIVLLTETDRDTAVQVAERLRASIAKKPFHALDRIISLTVSIGVATKDENTTHLEALIARADQALYIAKHKGRNRVAISV